MSKKVFMIFNDRVDKLKQAFWFVNMFIDEEYRDKGYLLGVGKDIIDDEYGITCKRDDGEWVWLGEHTIRGYTEGMTQVYYKQKDLGEL